ncbi:MAG: 1-acyl-sn-glycerol-3-phosphate acyltransferase [Firmicutes bacterium]|nr:1-acyl-sn-glycerol-3-phosphate acyltransferase [Bacillota bacterium]
MTAKQDPKNKKATKGRDNSRLTPGRIRLHRIIWKLGRPFMHPLMHRRYRFHAEPEQGLPSCFLLLCNHVTHLDPLLVVDSFPRQMYFVASEHIQRKKIAPLMMALTFPIIRRKSRTETGTAMDILRRLKAGCSVCVFIEGERSYAGQTEFIPDSAAHLAKMCGCALVTYRLEDGYFTEPRWASSSRPNGHMTGHVVNVYSPEELKAMSRQEALEHIRQDLWLDAYAVQEKEMLSYPGAALAEHLETALFYCPVCGALGRMKSKGDRFFCEECGLDLRYTEKGYLEAADGSEPPYTTVRDWFNWQKEAVTELADSSYGTHELLTADEDQLLFAVDEDNHTSRQIATGKLALYGDSLEFTAPAFELKLPLSRLNAVSCHESKLLSFSVNGEEGAGFYEVDCVTPRSAVKYQLMFRVLKERQLAEAAEKAPKKEKPGPAGK